MLVFWEQRLVFLATPKTGSTAIESALESLAQVAVLRPPELKHTSAHRYRRFLQPYLRRASGEDFTVVALMREPVSWLGSWYRYRRRTSADLGPRSTRDISFDTFVRGYLSSPCAPYAQVGQQSRFLGAGKPHRVDRIFPYERIDLFIDFLEDRLDFEITLPRVNVSPQAETTLTPETEALLRRRHKTDFDLYESLRTVPA